MFFRNTLIFSLSIYLAAHILPFRIALSINPPSQCIEKSNLISSKQTLKTRKQTQKCVQNESCKTNLMKKEWQRVIFYKYKTTSFLSLSPSNFVLLIKRRPCLETVVLIIINFSLSILVSNSD